MILHVHSQQGHEALVPLLTKRLVTSIGSLDPMPDGSTASVVVVTQATKIRDILSAVDGLTLIPSNGIVGKGLAKKIGHYGVKESDTKKEVLSALYAAQTNHFFDPMLLDA